MDYSPPCLDVSTLGCVIILSGSSSEINCVRYGVSVALRIIGSLIISTSSSFLDNSIVNEYGSVSLSSYFDGEFLYDP